MSVRYSIFTNISAVFSGLLFGSGLTISMMVDPQRVIGFLDIFGDWDATLIFVMLGGIIVYMPLYRLFIHSKQTTLLSKPIHLPQAATVDKSLITGAMTFGIGWGLTGICPGPAITSLSSGDSAVLIFIISMIFGMLIASKLKSKQK